jgi:cyclic pyranopterin phosphate synthase
MPLDSQRAWQKEMVVSHREMLDRLRRRFVLVPIRSDNPSETARRYAVSGGQGEIGIIASVTEPFCHHCSRLRLTAEGHLRTCLFSPEEHDLKKWVRGGVSDDAIRAELARLVHGKEARHPIGEPDFKPPERSMSCIGG